MVTPGSLDPGMQFGLEVKWLTSARYSQLTISHVLSIIIDDDIIKPSILI